MIVGVVVAFFFLSPGYRLGLGFGRDKDREPHPCPITRSNQSRGYSSDGF